jgi:predicted RNase H-like nuclease (RuvC/YqgF family)
MADDDQNLVENFEKKLKKLMELYEMLKNRNSELCDQLDQQKKENEMLRHEISALNENYSNLKQSKVLSVSGQDIDDTKQRVTRLVREIDRCIDMLNV